MGAMPKKPLLIGLFIFIFLLLSIVFIYQSTTSMAEQNKQQKFEKIEAKSTPYKVTQNNREKTKYPVDYTIVFVGDSMVETLGNF